MSTAYLQRLFDRTTAGAPAQVAPAGASQSPIAKADQRFNNPALARLFGFGLLGADVAGKDERQVAPPGDIPSPSFREVAARQPLPQTPVARTAWEAVDRSVDAMATEKAEPARLPFTAIGQVFPEDLAPPASMQEGVRTPSRESVSAEPLFASAAAARPPAPSEAIAAAQPSAAPERALLGPVPSPAPAIEVRAREIAAAPTPLVGAVAAEMDDDAEPAPIMMLPPRAAPQPLAAPETGASPAKAVRPAPHRTEPIREQPPVGVSAAETAPRKRPMTAAEASVIGPLVAEPRARTLFGLRRR